MEIIQPVSYYRVKSKNLLVHNVQIYKGEEEIAKNIDSLEQSKKLTCIIIIHQNETYRTVKVGKNLSKFSKQKIQFPEM